MNRKSFVASALFFGLLLSVMFWSACQKSGGANPWGDLGDWVVDTVYTEPATFSLTGWGFVYARIVDQETGAPYGNIEPMQVTFKSSSGDSIFDETLVDVGEDGLAMTRISLSGHVDSTETLIVIEASIDFPAHRVNTYYLHVGEAPVYAGDIIIDVNPDTLYAGSIDSFQVSATVLDSTGSAMPGVTVHFQRVSGSFIIPAGPYVTGSSGVVSAMIPSPGTPGESMIRAWVAGPGGTTMADTVSFYTIPRPPVSRVDITADPGEIVADGSSTILVTASIYAGEPPVYVEDGTPVSFTSERGTFVPYTFAAAMTYKDNPWIKTSKDELLVKSEFVRRSTKDALDEIVAYTSGGQAQVYLVVSTVADTVTLTASVDEIEGSVDVVFLPGAPYRIVLEAGDSSLVADGSDTTTITAPVYDRYNNTVLLGYQISFSTDLGTVSPSIANTNYLGIAKTTMRASDVSGLATITAQYSASVQSQIQIDIESTVPKYISISVDPSELTADRTSFAEVRAQVLDENYLPVTDGVPITFDASIGELSSLTLFMKKHLPSKEVLAPALKSTMSTFVGHTASGYAQVKLTSGALAGTCMLRASYYTGGSALTAADTAYIAFTPGAPNNITVTFGRDTIMANGADTTKVYAQVFDINGNPVRSGVAVGFVSGEAGDVFPLSQFTDATGTAWTVLTSGLRTGSQIVSATAGTAAFGMASVYLSPSEPRAIELNTEYYTRPADGSSTNTLTAMVYDSLLRPVSDGTRVTFHTDMGEFASSTLLRARHDSPAEGLSAISLMDVLEDDIFAYTEDGMVTMDLISPTMIGTAEVWAAVDVDFAVWDSIALDSVDIDMLADTVNIEYISGDIHSIALTATPDTIIADGYDRTRVCATVYDEFGNPLGSGIHVSFAPVPSSMGTTTPAYGYTDSTGTVCTWFNAATTSGIVSILASAGGASNTKDVVLLNSDATTLTLTLSSPTMSVDGGSVELTAHVYDAGSMPVSDGVPVDFTSTLGEIVPLRDLTTDGVATSFVYSTGVTGIDTIIAKVGAAVADTKYVEILPGTISRIVLTTEPGDSIYAGGLSSAWAVAQVFDSHDNPVEGVTVTFIIDAIGSIIPSSTTDSIGIARALITSPTETGVATIQATAGTATAFRPIYFIGSPASEIYLTVSSDEIRLDDVDTLTAIVLDSMGHVIEEGVDVSFSSRRGSIIPPFATVTDGSAKHYMHPEETGIDTIIASIGAIADTQYVEITPGLIASMDVVAVPDTIYANGSSTTTITATCYDSEGYLVGRGHRVEFSLAPSLGTLSTSFGITNSMGVATVTMRSGTETGVVFVEARFGALSEFTEVTLINSEAAEVILMPAALSFGIGGSNGLTVHVYDGDGEPITDNTIVALSSNLSILLPSFPRTTDGIATSVMNDLGELGIDTIIATVGDVADTAVIEILPGTVANLKMEIADSMIYANGTSRTKITITATDISGNPVAEGTTINVSTTLGELIPGIGITDETGKAELWLYSSPSPGIAVVTAWIGSFTDIGMVEFIESPVGEIQLIPSSTRIGLGDVDTLTIMVLDSFSNPIDDDTPVEMRSLLGMIAPRVPRTTGGEAVTYLYTMGETGVDTIIATVGTLSDTAYITIEAGTPDRIILESEFDTLYANGVSRSLITARIVDVEGHSLGAGLEVAFSSELGSIPAVGLTDTMGVASVYLVAGRTAGTDIIRASYEDVAAGINIFFELSDAAWLQLLPSTINMQLGETDTLDIIAYDEFSEPVSDSTRVMFSSKIGLVLPPTVRTGGGGARSFLYTNGVTGVDTVVAWIGDAFDTALVTISAGVPDRIEISAAQDSCYANGIAAIPVTAVVYDSDDNPVGAGTRVDFETSLGSLMPVFMITDASGEAVVDFLAPSSPGVAVITASVSGREIEASTTIRVVISPIGEVNLVSSSSSITLDEVDTMTAWVFDDEGSYISDGTRVEFRSCLGIMVPPFAFVAGGQAVSMLHPDRVTGIDTIIAIAGDIADTQYVEITPGLIASMDVVAAPETIYANGSSTTTITATCYDADGYLVGRGNRIDFSIAPVLGTLSSSFGITNSAGVATVRLTSGTETGVVFVEAGYGDLSEFVEVTLINSEAAEVILMPDGLSFAIGETNDLTIHVYDASGEPITDNTIVELSSNLSILLPSFPRTTDGLATSVMHDLGELGIDTVIATVGDVADTAVIEILPGNVANIDMVIADSMIYANGTSRTLITLTVTDIYGNPVAEGTIVNMSTSLGELIPTVGITDENGRAELWLYSSVSPGIAVVTAWIGSITDIGLVEFMESPVGEVQLLPSSSRIGLGDVDTLRIMVLDTFSNPIDDDTPVEMRSVLGMIAPRVPRTTGGEAVTYLYTMGETGVDTIIATVGTLSDTAYITIEAGIPDRIILESEFDTMYANGVSRSLITARIVDVEGHSLGAGLEVAFSSELGTIPTVGLTDTLGIASVYLVSGRIAGTDIIRASYEDVAAGINIFFELSDAAWIQLLPSTTDLRLGETDTLEIIAYDEFSEPVSDSTRVMFSSKIAMVIPPTARTGGGNAQTFLYTNSITGIDTVVAWIGDAFDTAFVTISAGIPDHIAISANPDSCYANGISAIPVTAIVYDRDGNPVGGGVRVDFETSMGSIMPTYTVTDIAGQVVVDFMAPSTPGVAVITASVSDGEVEASTSIRVRLSPIGEINLVPSSTVITLDEIGTMTAWVFDDSGSYISDGTRVEFRSNLGIMVPPFAYTTEGQAVSLLHTQRITGTDTVIAIAGDLADTVLITIEAGVPSYIRMWSDPDSIPADGFSTGTIYAQAFDESDNPIGSDYVIRFAVDIGGITSSSSTDGSGIASATYTASTETGIAEITASMSEFGISTMLPYRLYPVNIDELILIPYSSSIGLDQVDTIQIIATDEDGFYVSDGTRVTLTSTLTDVDPRLVELESGRGFTYTFPRTGIGMDTVIARAGSVADTVIIGITNGDPYEIIVTADPESLYANGVSTAQITAEVYDRYGHPVLDLTTVHFETDLGSIVASASLDSGVAVTTFMSEPTPGIATIRASIGDVEGVLIYKLISSDAASMILYSDSYRIQIGEHATITATVYDADDSYISDGTMVDFSSAISVIDPRRGFTSSGSVTTTLTPIRNTGMDTIIATVGTVVETLLIEIEAGTPAIVELEADPEAIYANGTQSTIISATVKDELGNPVGPGVFVDWEHTLGTLLSDRSSTNDSSIARTTVISGTSRGICNVTATAGDASNSIPIEFMHSNAGEITLIASDFIVTLGNNVDLTAIVSDSDGMPISDDTQVFFTSNIGTIIPGMDLSSGGEANALFRTSTDVGLDTVIAFVDTLADTVFITIQPDEPAYIELIATRDSLYANGMDTTTLTARVYDRYGNPVANGYPISFATTLGEVLPVAYTADSGRAVSRFTSGNLIGRANVTASWSGVVGVEDIRLYRSDAARMILRASSLTLSVDELDTITAAIFDDMDIPIADGAVVAFTSRLMNADPYIARTEDGDAISIMEPIGITGIDTVTATIDTLSDTLIVTILSGPPSTIVLTAVPDTIPADGVSISTVTATVTDEYGNPVSAGFRIDFDATRGSLESSFAYTDVSGTCFVTLISSMDDGLSIVRANYPATGAASQIPIYFENSDVGRIILSIARNIVQVGEATTNELTALVLDSSGRRVTDGTTIDFAAILGDALPPLATTEDGLAYSAYSPGTETGIDTVVASYGELIDVADTIIVAVQAGVCQIISLDATPDDSIAADGRSRTTIEARCTDFYGNTLPQGKRVNFSTTLGAIVSVGVTDTSGIAQTSLTSAPEIGVATVQASLEDGIGTINVPFFNSPVAFISINATPREITADGTSTSNVEVTVLDETGAGISEGTLILNSVNLATLDMHFGEIDTLVLFTDGYASTVLRSEAMLGTATVIARVHGVYDSVDVDFIPGPPDEIIADATPDTIPADGLTRSVITATVFDEYGNIVEKGTEVTFSTNLGTIDPDRGWTDSLGQVSVELQSASVTGRATVTIEAGTAVTFQRVVFSELVAGSVSLFSDSLSMVANGTSRTWLTATVLDTAGLPVPDGTPIMFHTTAGILIPNYAYTEESNVRVQLRSDVTVGIAEIWATASDSVTSDTLEITFRPGQPASIVLTATPNSLPADGDSSSNVTAYVRDANNNVVLGGTAVYFSSSLGEIDTVSFTDSLGYANTIFTAGIVPGISQILANSGDALGQTTISLMNTNVATIFVNVEPNRIIANGSQTAAITGRALNSSGAPVSNNTPISFGNDPIYGSVIPTTARTDSGYFEVTYQAGTITGNTDIWAFSGSIYDTTDIELIPGPADSIALVADTNSIPADSLTTTGITANLYDRYGNRLQGGTVVHLENTLGTLSDTEPVTNSSGAVNVTLLSGRRPGICRIIATADDARKEIEVAFSNTQGHLVIVLPDDDQLTADGASSTMIRANVTDSLGNPISDGSPVRFTLLPDSTGSGDTLGLLIPEIAYTTTGDAVVQLRAGTQAGRCNIRANSGTVYGTGFVEFVAGSPDYIVMVPEDSVIQADGADMTDINCVVFDRYDNPVSSGWPVSFSATRGGSVSPASVTTNGDGEVTTTLTASNEPGISRVFANSGDAYGSVDVRFSEVLPAYLSLIANPIRITADGTSTSRIKAKVLNALGLPVPSGTILVFHSRDTSGADFGVIETLSVTNAAGETELDLTSETRTGTAVISARVASLSDTTQVEFIPGPVALITVIPESDVLYADGRDETTVRIVMSDINGNRVARGTAATVATDLGEIYPTTIYTLDEDTITVTYTSATGIGRANITVTSGGVTGVASIELIESEARHIELVIDSLSLIANGYASTQMRAYILDAELSPISDGTRVIWSTNEGRILPNVTYSEDGVVMTTLTAGLDPDSTAMIIVSAGSDAVDTGYVEFRTGPPVHIRVVADSTTLPADGDATCSVRAYVTDVNDNPVEDDFEINFITSLGSIGGLAVTSEYAGTLGVAEVEFFAGVETGAAIITASYGSVRGYGRIDLIDADASDLSVNISPYVLVADGRATATVSGFVRNDVGNPVSDGTAVMFSVSSDTLGVPMGNVSPFTAYTDGGAFTATYTSGTLAGTGLVYARVGDTLAIDSTSFDLIAGDPDSILVEADPTWINADSASISNLTGTVFDRYNNHVAGASVTLSTTLGTILPPITVTTNTDGEFTSRLRSGYSTGTATVTAQSMLARGETEVVFDTSSVYSISLTGDPRVLTADGFSESELVATVLDSSGHSIADGTIVTFGMVPDTLGDLIPELVATSSGIASTIFRTGDIRGEVFVSATAGAVSDTIRIELRPGAPYSMVLEAVDTTISANGRDNTEITATVRDSRGNLVSAGETVQFTTSLGIIAPTTTITDAFGVARTTITAGTTPGSARVTARSGDAFDIMNLNLAQSQISSISMTATPRELVADGSSSSIVTASVFDIDGSPVTDGTRVDFSVSGGYGTILTPKLTAGGSVTTQFISGTEIPAGGRIWLVAEVTDSIGVHSDSTWVILRPGTVANIQVYTDSTRDIPDTIYADGSSSIWVYARLTDTFGNHLRSGNFVSFVTDLGQITVSGTTDSLGVTRANLRSGFTPGTANIVASSGGISGFGQVVFDSTAIGGIYLTADRTRLIANGSDETTLTAELYTATGVPVSDGTLVMFSVPDASGDTTIVSILPTIAYTDSGKVSVTVRADTIAVSSFTIEASSGSETGSIAMFLDPGLPARIAVHVADDSIPADGITTVAVACTLYDDYNNHVDPGVAVSFETTRGTIPGSSTTDLSGAATVLLQSGTAPGVSLITVRSGSATGFAQVTFTELVADNIVLTGSPTSIDVTSGGSVTMHAIVQDSEGLSVSDGTKITFSLDDGFVEGIITPTIAFTEDGTVDATLTPLDTKGTCRVIATYSATVADTFDIRFLPGAPNVINFDTTAYTFQANGNEYEITAYVIDEYGNGVSLGTPVSFTSSPIGEALASNVSDSIGTVTTYVSSDVIGTAYVRAMSGSAISHDLVRINYIPVEGDSIIMTVNPIRLIANGTSTASVVANVVADSAGTLLPVSDGLPVFFSTTAGFIDPLRGYTLDGRVTATLTSSIVIDTNVVVTASLSSSVSSSFSVEFIPGAVTVVEFIESTIRPLNANGEDTIHVMVLVTDEYGNPVAAGKTVNFTTSRGEITFSDITDDDGYASAVLTSGTAHGSVLLSATCSGVTGYANTNFTAVTAATIDLVATPILLTADGVSTSELTAYVYDALGALVSDGNTVSFSQSDGYISPRIVSTVGGIARTTLTSSIVPNDSVKVVATSGLTARDSVFIDFKPGNPYYMTITSSKASMTANSSDTCLITIAVFDEYGNPVGDAVSINLEVTSGMGSIPPSTITDPSGTARAVFTTGTVSGWAVIRASYGTIDAELLMQLIPTDVAEVNLVVSPTRLIADGEDNADVTVTVLDGTGAPVSDGTPVRFMAPSLSTITPIYGTTSGGTGTFYATLTALTTTGFDTLIVAVGSYGDTVSFELRPGAPDYMEISTADDVLLANGTDATTISAIIYDEYGNTVSAGQEVNFTLTPSTIGEVWAVTTTDADGECSVGFTAGTDPGLASIRATAGAATGIVQIQLNPTDVDRIILANIGSSILTADGRSTTDISALVLDADSSPITNGTRVNFVVEDSHGGAYFYPSWATTDSGLAIATLTASTEVETSYVYAYVSMGITTVASEDTIRMIFTVGDAASIDFVRPSAPDLTANGYDTYEDTVIVYDSFGNTVPDAVVNFSLTTGNVVPSVDITDGSGEVAFEITAPTSLGFGFLTVTSGSATAWRTVEYVSTGVDTIVLNVSPRGLPANGVASATVRAVVLDGTGAPVSDGLTINFRTSAGYIDPIATTLSGTATTTLIAADYADTAFIWAEIGTKATVAICIFEAGEPDEVTLSISPSDNTVGSTSLNTVDVTVVDELGNPVAEGTIVNLSVSDADFGSLSENVVATDDEGSARVFFTPGTKNGICWIRASSGSVSDSGYILIDSGDPYTMEFEVSDSAIYVRGVGEIDQSTIYAYVYDIFGNPVADSTEVVFEIVSYPSGGTSISPTLFPPGTSRTSGTRYTFGGRATVTLRAGSKSGTIEVEANVEGGVIVSSAPRITVRSGDPSNISLSDSLCNVPGWNTDGMRNTVTAIVSDSNDNPVAPGTAVYFYTEEGVVTGAAVTDNYGIARATWFSADPRNDGQVEVYATITVGSSSIIADTTRFYMSGPPADIPSVTTFDASIDADGSSSTTVRATVEDVNGNPVADGLYSLNFVTTKGTITGSPATITYTCGETTAEAEATIRSQVCASDAFAASYDVAQPTITAYRGGISGNTTMTFLNGDPSTDHSTISGPEQVGLSATIPILVTVKDPWGNPIAGVDVAFGASAGTIPAGPIASNALGYVTTSYTSHSVEESVIISATLDGGAVVYYMVSVVAPAKGNEPVAPRYEVNDLKLFENFEKLGIEEQKELLKRMQLLPSEETETTQTLR